MNFIKISHHSDYTIVSLHRPEMKNAFHPAMIAEITDFFKHYNEKKIIVLRGSGGTFCAGADLGWMRDMVKFSLDENREDAVRLWSMFHAVKNCPAPVMAIAEGVVFGGALGLLACSDYVVADSKTQFCFSETRLGLLPAVISDFILNKVSDGSIRPLMLSAEAFSVEKAVAVGLVSRVYSGLPSDSEIAQLLTANGFEAMCAAKKLLNTLQFESDPEVRKNVCVSAIAERRVSPEAQGLLKNFLERKTSK